MAKKIVRSAMSGFVTGVASVTCLMPGRGLRYGVDRPFARDSDGIRSSWKAVGHDLDVAMKRTYGKQQAKSTKR